MAAPPITDEPARGVVSPPWMCSLPGIERVRLYARSTLPATPVARLAGLGIGHFSAGNFTGTMRAGAHFTFIPAITPTPGLHNALYGAVLTAIGPGLDAVPITGSLQYFRHPRPQPGSFLCRARVVNASDFFIAVAADMEDPVGRLVGHTVSHWAVRAVEPPPPSPPASIEPVGESTYATPDPPDRPPVGAPPPTHLADRLSGLELARMIVAGELPPLPLMHTLGLRWEAVEEGTSTITMPASEWFGDFRRAVSPGIMDAFLGSTIVGAAITLQAPGQSAAVLEVATRIARPVALDGRRLSARGRLVHRTGNVVMAEGEAVDADGHVAALGSAVVVLLDPRERRRPEPERVLATLLFTDIVGSTQHAERLGDAAWRALLGEHRALVRSELGAHRGRELQTTGDGFLARFDSPASAIRCAKAIRDGVRRLHLEIRAGIHTGECEVEGAELAGIAVHVAARIVALASPGEVLVSQTVRDLAAGSGLRFAGRGAHALRGVEGEWNLFAVDSG
jgi:class 3 adenylate cyclase